MAEFSDFKDRLCPAWFEKPQLGIFVHWGLYSVPAYAPRGHSIHDLMRENYDNATVLSPYAEWYQNAMTVAGSPTAQHHKQTYGDRPYRDFRDTFDAQSEAFDAQAWAQTFVEAGASYVVFVTKHHDGYCLWPTQVENPHLSGWHTQRDFVGELANAVREKGMRFGVYYSGGLDWTFHHTPISNLGNMLGCVPPGKDYADYASAQLRELIDRYQPSLIWNDIAWPDKTDVPLLFADYYAAVPDGVVNDRWLGEKRLFASLRTPEGLAQFNDQMKATIAATGGNLDISAPPHCDFRTVEYGLGCPPADKKWEACRGVGQSFGYCSSEQQSDHLNFLSLQVMREDVASKGGNLLINIGPMADGTIPALQMNALIQERAPKLAPRLA